jgi:hypothetical protein
MTALAVAAPAALEPPTPTSFDDWRETGKALSRLLRYEPETGKLFWLHRQRAMFPDERAWKIWNTRYDGAEAFTAIANGYHRGAIFGTALAAHRVAWAIHHGEWPKGQIDHINGDRSDNRIANLRDVDSAGNHKNMSRASNNKSGVTGVHWCNTWNRWIAKIKIGGKTKSLGQFASFDDAVAARQKAQEELGFDIGHGKEPVQ